MFEEYLEDSLYFAKEAIIQKDASSSKRHFRVSVFCSMSSIESYVNYMIDTLLKGFKLEGYEKAFLTDKHFDVFNGSFKITSQNEYHKIDDKIRYLLCKSTPTFDFNKNASWSRLLEFKRFRDSLIHPKQVADINSLTEYKKRIKIGLEAIILIMNHICKGIFKKPLRKHILDIIDELKTIK